ncbi:hypothetical protein Aduo_002944 [Ancylostoma duodenale]
MVGFTDRNACDDDTVVLVLRRSTFKRSDKVAPPNVDDNDYDDSAARSGPSVRRGLFGDVRLLWKKSESGSGNRGEKRMK